MSMKNKVLKYAIHAEFPVESPPNLDDLLDGFREYGTAEIINVAIGDPEMKKSQEDADPYLVGEDDRELNR